MYHAIPQAVLEFLAVNADRIQVEVSATSPNDVWISVMCTDWNRNSASEKDNFSVLSLPMSDEDARNWLREEFDADMLPSHWAL